MIIWVQAFRSVGMELNMTKVKIWARRQDTIPSSLRQHATNHITCLGTKMISPGEEEHQGAPITSPTGAITDEILRLAKLTDELRGLRSVLCIEHDPF